jgi:Family of unknown function (DUF6677)
MTARTDMESPANTRPQQQQSVEPMTTMGILAPLAGWIIPGAGHLLLRRWVRGLLLMVCIVTMFLLGLAMEGKLYSANTGDLLDILGFVGDLGAGLLYVVGKSMGLGAGNIARATADYGTKFLIVAGLLNIIAAVDAHHIAIGKKP